MSNGSYIICPKCNSAKVEIVQTGTKTKVNWMCLISKNASQTKRVIVQKKHCLNCGYLW